MAVSTELGLAAPNPYAEWQGQNPNDSPERWAKFQQCLCYNFDTDTFCDYTPNLGLGLSALKQCLPYIGFLFNELSPLLIINVVLWNVFVLFIIFRYACGVFGGGRPSPGIFKIKKRRLFKGYSRLHVWVFKILCLLVCGAAGAFCAKAVLANDHVSDAVNDAVNEARDDLKQINQAVKLGNTLFNELVKFGFTSGDLKQADSLLNTVGSYTGNVGTALDYIVLVNGSDDFIGRTQIVQYVLLWMIGLIGACLVLGLVNISLRGFCHNLLALIITFSTFGLVLIAIVHLILHDTFGDIYFFFEGVEARAGEAASQACGQAALQSIQSLRKLAVNQFASHALCGSENPYGKACLNYYNCSYYSATEPQYDICTWRNEGRDVGLKQLETAFGKNVLECSKPPQKWEEIPCWISKYPLGEYGSMYSCAIGLCGGNHTEQALLAQKSIALTAAVAIVIKEIDEKVVPYVNCQIGFASWQVLLVKIKDMGRASYDLLFWTSVFLGVSWFLAFAFIPLSKRFTSRNHVNQLKKRRKKRMEKNRTLVEKAITEWANLDPDGDQGAIDQVKNMSFVAPLLEYDDDLTNTTSGAFTSSANSRVGPTGINSSGDDVNPSPILRPGEEVPVGGSPVASVPPTPSRRMREEDLPSRLRDSNIQDQLLDDMDGVVESSSDDDELGEWAILRHAVTKKSAKRNTLLNALRAAGRGSNNTSRRSSVINFVEDSRVAARAAQDVDSGSPAQPLLHDEERSPLGPDEVQSNKSMSTIAGSRNNREE